MSGASKRAEPERPANICPHGKHWTRCREQSCIEEMIAAEDAATCPHGYLVGCPTCIAAIAKHRDHTMSEASNPPSDSSASERPVERPAAADGKKRAFEKWITRGGFVLDSVAREWSGWSAGWDAAQAASGRDI